MYVLYTKKWKRETEYKYIVQPWFDGRLMEGCAQRSAYNMNFISSNYDPFIA